MKRVFLLVLAMLLLSGCGRQADTWTASGHLVVSVLVEDGGESLLFREPEKVRAVLSYFRSLETAPAELAPREGREVTFLFADGHRKTEFLLDERYLRIADGPWLAVSGSPIVFRQLLDEIPPDEKWPLTTFRKGRFFMRSSVP